MAALLSGFRRVQEPDADLSSRRRLQSDWAQHRSGSFLYGNSRVAGRRSIRAPRLEDDRSIRYRRGNRVRELAHAVAVRV